MTIDTERKVRSIELVRARFEPVDALRLSTFQALVAGLDDLIFLFVLAAEIAEPGIPMQRVGGEIPEERRKREIGYSIYSASRTQEEELHLRRIKYESPLEVVLALGGSVSATTLTVNRLLATWRNWQAARVEHAQADLEVAARQLLLSDLRAGESGARIAEAIVFGGLEGRVDAGAKTLTEVGSLEVLTPTA
jgi:hypothetical protein